MKIKIYMISCCKSLNITIIRALNYKKYIFILYLYTMQNQEYIMNNESHIVKNRKICFFN